MPITRPRGASSTDCSQGLSKGTSIINKCLPPEFYIRPVPRVLWWSWGVIYVPQLLFPTPWVPVLPVGPWSLRFFELPT